MATPGDRLLELRKKLGVSQYELSDMTKTKDNEGISRSAIASYEVNKRIPPINNLTILAKLFGVTESYIINGKDSMEDALEDEFTEGFQMLRRANEVLEEEERKELLKYMDYLITKKMNKL